MQITVAHQKINDGNDDRNEFYQTKRARFLPVLPQKNSSIHSFDELTIVCNTTWQKGVWQGFLLLALQGGEIEAMTTLHRKDRLDGLCFEVEATISVDGGAVMARDKPPSKVVDGKLNVGDVLINGGKAIEGDPHLTIFVLTSVINILFQVCEKKIEHSKLLLVPSRMERTI